jgi:hypothetical protein
VGATCSTWEKTSERASLRPTISPKVFCRATAVFRQELSFWRRFFKYLVSALNFHWRYGFPGCICLLCEAAIASAERVDDRK